MRIDQIAYIVGMPRAGTTFLYHNLQKHPQIFVPFRRKTNFFSLHVHESEDWYLSHFRGMKRPQIGIDTETLWFVDPDIQSLERIRSFNPHAKAMLFVRRPGEWAQSLYKQVSTFDRNIPEFGVFLNGGYTLVEDDARIPFKTRDGDIERNISKAQALFGNDLLIVNFDFLKKDPLRILQEIEKFLGLASYFNPDNFDDRKINAGDRRHIVWIGLLLRSRFVVSLVRRLPKNLVTYLRGIYDSLGAGSGRGEDAHLRPRIEEEKMASAFYAGDEIFVENLFKGEKAFQLGGVSRDRLDGSMQ